MGYPMNSLTDIYTVIANERKLGGVIEAEFIRLRSGEQFPLCVITSVEMSGSHIYNLGFINNKGKRFICHIDEISLISEAVHKRICEMENKAYKDVLTERKITYLKRLLEVNEGSSNPVFLNEMEELVLDIGIDTLTTMKSSLSLQKHPLESIHQKQKSRSKIA
jgi:hypothetical protein